MRIFLYISLIEEKTKKLKQKNKILYAITIIFFLIVNTSYYWKSNLGFISLPISLILFLVYLGLCIITIRYIFLAFKERSINKKQMFSIGLLLIVLILTFIKPFGIIDFEKFESKNILIAEREGVAGCSMTLKLKENKKFTAKSVCFGMTETIGKYEIKNDTIYFYDIKLGRNDKEFYKFAVLKPSKKFNNSKSFTLLCFKSKNDTIGHGLKVKHNGLK